MCISPCCLSLALLDSTEKEVEVVDNGRYLTTSLTILVVNRIVLVGVIVDINIISISPVNWGSGGWHRFSQPTFFSVWALLNKRPNTQNRWLNQIATARWSALSLCTLDPRDCPGPFATNPGICRKNQVEPAQKTCGKIDLNQLFWWHMKWFWSFIGRIFSTWNCSSFWCLLFNRFVLFEMSHDPFSPEQETLTEVDHFTLS